MPKSISIPQEGGDKEFRSPNEIAGNTELQNALDANDSLQVSAVFSATNGDGGASGTTFETNTNLTSAGVSVGDFLTVNGVEGFFVIASITTGFTTDSLITFDVTTQLRTGTAATVSGGILNDGAVSPDFNVAPVVLVGDKVIFLTPVSAAFSSPNADQVFNVTSVGATTLTLDGVPADDASGTADYSVYRPPTLVILPVSLHGATSLVFQITKGSSSTVLQAPSKTRMVGFGDAAFSRVVNRAVKALSDNSEYLRALLESRIALARREAVTTSVSTVTVTTASVTGGIWTGQLNKASFTQAEISQFARVVDNNGLDVEVSGTTAIVTDIEDNATSTSILGSGFVTPTQLTSVDFILNVTIPGTVPDPIFVVHGQGRSIKDIVQDEPDALLKTATSLVGINDEEIPELVNARDSARLGTFANVDARLESIENRIVAWTWQNTPVFRFDAAGSIHFAAATIFYEGVLFTASSGSFTTPAGGGGNIGQGFIVGTLNTAGNILTFTALDIGPNDFDSLTLAPDQVVVGSYIPTNQINVFNFQTKDSALTFTLEPALEVVNTGSEFFVGWRNPFQVTWKGNTYDGQSSSPTVIGVAGPFNIVGASNDVLTFAFDDTAVTFSVTLTAGGARTAQQVADDINAATDFPLGLGTLATVLNNKVVMRSPSVIGDPLGQALRITGNGATTVFGSATNDGFFAGVDLADGEILTVRIDESQSDFQVELRKEVAAQILNVRRSDNKLLIAARSGTQLIPRGSLKDLEPHLVIKGSEELKQVLAVDVAENEIDSAGLQQLDVVRLADFSPATSNLQGVIAMTDMSELGSPANNDIHLSLYTDYGRQILGRTELVDVSDVGDYIGLPVSDHPSDIAIDTRSNGDLVIAWGDAGTDDGVYTVIADRTGSIVRAADQTFAAANPVDYFDMAIMPNDQIFYAWVEDGASDVLRVGRSSDNGASMAATLAVDTDADSSIRHVAVEIIDTGDANRVRALVFYGKGPSTVTDHRLQVAIIDIDLVAGLSVVATKAAGNFTFEENGNISSAKTHLNTVGILMNDSTEDKIIEFDQDGEPLDFQAVSSDAELGNAREAIAAAGSTDKRVTALAAPNKNIVGGEQLFYWFATTDGTGTFTGDRPVLGLLGWPASVRPSVANPLAEGGSDLKILRQTLVGHRDKYLTGESRGQRVEVLSLSVALAVLTAHNSQGVSFFSFAQPYTTPPSILVSAKKGSVTGDDALIWSVDPAFVTTQGFSVEIFNSNISSTGTGNALATAYIIGN